MEKSVEQLRKELAEAEAREQGLMNEPYVAVCWSRYYEAYAFLKKQKNGKYLRVSEGALMAGCEFPEVTNGVEYLTAITAEQFNAAYDEAMAKIKEAKDE